MSVNVYRILWINVAFHTAYYNRVIGALSVTTCEGSELIIDCGDQPIDILSAWYGRGDKYTCSPHHRNTECWGTKTESVVKSFCQDQHQCSVLVNNYVLKEDPCPNTAKYMLLNYSCGFEIKPDEPSCIRKCKCPISETDDFQDILEQFRRTMNVLRLNKRNLTSFQRRLISTSDERITAKSMGIVAVILLISLASVVVVPDLYMLFRFWRRNSIVPQRNSMN